MQKYNDQLQGFKNLYHVTGIPFIIVSHNGQVVLSYPENSDIYYNSEYWSGSPMGNIKDRHPNDVTLFEVGEFCYVAIVKLDTNLFFATVPVRSSNKFPHSFFPVMVQGIKSDLHVDFYRMLLDVPPKTDCQLAEFASLAKVIYCGEPANGISFHPYVNKNSFHEIPETIQILETLEDKGNDRHLPMDFEAKVIDAITTGNRRALLDALNRPPHGRIGKMSLNELHQCKYQFICMMFASSRAAIAGGLTQEYAFSLSDQFCQRMDEMKSIEDIEKYFRICLLEFCYLVSRNKHTATYSSYTQNILDYISQHLLESLSVEKISKAIGLNRKSLTQYFKADMNMTIPEYILDKRLAEAEYLLKSSSLSLSAISELLQFSSQSHFTQRFREKYGVTPWVYRN